MVYKGFIFLAPVISFTSYDNTVDTKATTVISKRDGIAKNRSNRATNTSRQTIIQVENKFPG